ncbi:MAG: hypothetical protein QM805_07705 [Pseudomonas sp.]
MTVFIPPRPLSPPFSMTNVRNYIDVFGGVLPAGGLGVPRADGEIMWMAAHGTLTNQALANLDLKLDGVSQERLFTAQNSAAAYRGTFAIFRQVVNSYAGKTIQLVPGTTFVVFCMGAFAVPLGFRVVSSQSGTPGFTTLGGQATAGFTVASIPAGSYLGCMAYISNNAGNYTYVMTTLDYFPNGATNYVGGFRRVHTAPYNLTEINTDINTGGSTADGAIVAAVVFGKRT